MSMIKAWLHDQMEKEIREEEMFFNADKHYEAEQAMREGMVGLATPDGVSWFDPALDFAELDNMIQELSE